MALIPYVIEKNENGERSYDLYSRLLEDRIIMISGEIDQHSMDIAVGELLFLNSQDSERPIYVYIDSPGGEVVSGLGSFISTMKFIKAPVYTIALGMAASMGAVILSAGEPGHRYCLPHSQILVHPMSGGQQGRTRDNTISSNYEKRLQNYLLAEIAHNCHQLSDESYKEIQDAVQDMEDNVEYPEFKISKSASKELEKFKNSNDYDHWMFAKKALKFGIVDQILTSEEDLA